jgi:hypothetical protein
MKNQSTEFTKEQRRRLARAIKAIILGKSSVEGLQNDGQKTKISGSEDTEDSTQKTKSSPSSLMKPRPNSAFGKRRNLNKLSIRI